MVGAGGAPEKLIMKGRSERIIRRREMLLLLSLLGLVFESNDPLRKVYSRQLLIYYTWFKGDPEAHEMQCTTWVRHRSLESRA